VSSIRKLVLHFSHFFGGSAVILLLGFVTFPILTRLLTREEYGILGLVTNTVAIAVALAKGGLSDGIIRFYHDYAATPERMTLFTSTVLTRGVLLAAAVVAMYLLALPHINVFVGINPHYLDCFLVMGLYLFVRPLNIIVLNYLRALGKIFLFNVVNVATKTLGVALAFALLLWLVGELYGYLLGLALAEIGAAIFLYRWLLAGHHFSIRRVSRPLTLNLLKFGVPLLLTELAYLLLSYADRYMIVAYHGEAMVGLYSVGYNLPSYLNELIMFSLSYAVVPIYTGLYTREGKEATERFLSRSFRYYLIGVIPLCLGYWAVARDLLVVLASPKYADAARFSPLILVGLVFLGMNSLLYAGLYLEKKSLHILGIMFAAVTVNILLNFVLLPSYGVMGASIATLIACMVSTLLMGFWGFRYVRVVIPVATIIYYLAASVLMYVLLIQIDTASGWLNLLGKIPVGAAVVAIAVLCREAEIRAHTVSLLTKLRQRFA